MNPEEFNYLSNEAADMLKSYFDLENVDFTNELLKYIDYNNGQFGPTEDSKLFQEFLWRFGKDFSKTEKSMHITDIDEYQKENMLFIIKNYKSHLEKEIGRIKSSGLERKTEGERIMKRKFSVKNEDIIAIRDSYCKLEKLIPEDDLLRYAILEEGKISLEQALFEKFGGFRINIKVFSDPCLEDKLVSAISLYKEALENEIIAAKSWEEKE